MNGSPDTVRAEEAPRPKKILRLVYKFILISIAVHVVGLLIFGGFIIFKRLQPEPVQFEEPVQLKRIEPKKREYKMRVKEQQSRSSRPKIQPRLQSVRPSPLAMPTIDTKITPVKSELTDLPGVADGWPGPRLWRRAGRIDLVRLYPRLGRRTDGLSLRFKTG